MANMRFLLFLLFSLLSLCDAGAPSWFGADVFDSSAFGSPFAAQPDRSPLESIGIYIMFFFNWLASLAYSAALNSLASSAISTIGCAGLLLAFVFSVYRFVVPREDQQRWIVNFNNVNSNQQRALANLIRPPPEFNGQEDVNVWLTKLEHYLTTTALDKRQWAIVAISHINSNKLKHMALDEIYNDPINGFEKLKRELKRGTDKREEKPANIKTIAARVQLQHESVQQYGDKLKEMASAAFPGAPANMVDDNIKEIFVSGLRDEALRDIAGNKWFKTKDQHLPFEALVKYVAIKEQNRQWQRDHQLTASSATSTSQTDCSSNEAQQRNTNRREADRHDANRGNQLNTHSQQQRTFNDFNQRPNGNTSQRNARNDRTYEQQYYQRRGYTQNEELPPPQYQQHQQLQQP